MTINSKKLELEYDPEVDVAYLTLRTRAGAPAHYPAGAAGCSTVSRS